MIVPFAILGHVSQSLTRSVTYQSFLRYFQPIDYLFVQWIFRTIANIDLKAQFDPQNIAQILGSMESETSLPDKFIDLSISLGDHPDVREEDRAEAARMANYQLRRHTCLRSMVLAL